MRTLFPYALLMLMTTLFGCGTQVVGWPADTVRPTVTSTLPEDGADEVNTDTEIQATFSQFMDPQTFTSGSILLRDTTTWAIVSGEPSYEGATASFTPDGPLEGDTEYEATVSADVANTDGVRMASDHVWTFRTTPDPAATRPTVLFSSPESDEAEVSLHRSVSAVFSLQMDPSSLTDQTFSVMEGTNTVDGDIEVDGELAMFTPTAPLNPSTVYTATLTTGVQSASGESMATAYTWMFTTTDTPLDELVPLVISTSPEDNDIDVSLDTWLTANFNTLMDPLTIHDQTFVVLDGAVEIGGTVLYAGTTATFRPDAELDPDTVYQATITTDATSAAGVALASDASWSFTTTTDAGLPFVVQTDPAHLDEDVALNTSVTASFSEAMAGASINTSSFQLTGPLMAPVLGTVTYNALTMTATFAPIEALIHGVVYTGTITTDATDLAMNGMFEDYVWTFTTADAPPPAELEPLVISTWPEDNEIDVPLDAWLTANFNTLMDPLTINDQTFVVLDGAVEIAGTVLYAGTTATFRPDAELDPDTLYEATITTAATSAAGVAMVDDATWTFTTTVDPGLPFVIHTDPADLEQDVALDTWITAEFSEEMAEASINESSFLVTGPLNSPVLGTVMYDPITLTATFAPDQVLVQGIIYTATITTEATDLALNEMLEDYVWTFTTDVVFAGELPLDLGSLGTFVAVAGQGITNTGPTDLNGDVGIHPGELSSCVGCALPDMFITGTLYAADEIALQAKNDLVDVLIEAQTRTPTHTKMVFADETITPGVYWSESSQEVTGTVILDGEGDPNAVFIFQAGSTLTVATGAKVVLANGTQSKHVYWAVNSSSTILANATVHGTVMAQASNSVETGAIVIGRLLCTEGSITLLSNTILLPPE